MGKIGDVDEFRDAKFVNVTNFSIYELRGLRQFGLKCYFVLNPQL